MKFTILGSTTVDKVKEFESNLPFKLPNDYKCFLEKNNGVKLNNQSIYIEELNERILLDIFYGLNIKGRFDIKEANEEFAFDLPDKSIVIGEDLGGGLILLIHDDKNNGIYYYDHSYFFEKSDCNGNTYYISDSFSDFLKKIEDNG